MQAAHVAAKFTPPVLLLLIATSVIFISRESLLVRVRAKNRNRSAGKAGILLVCYLSIALSCGLPLVFYYHLWWLVPLGLFAALLLGINGKQGVEMADRTVKSETMAICGLCLTAPAAYYTASGRWDNTALWLWSLSVLFFVSSVYYVRLRVLDLNPRREQLRQKIWHQCALYHSFLLVALLLLFFTGSLSLFAPVAFLPAFARTLWSLLKPARQLDLKRAGILERCYAIIFLIFITLTFR